MHGRSLAGLASVGAALLAVAGCSGIQGEIGSVPPTVQIVVGPLSAARSEPPRLAPAGVIVFEAQPRHMAATPDGARLVVATMAVDGDTPLAGLAVVDTGSRQVIGAVPIGEGYPFQVVLSPEGSLAYVAVSSTSGTGPVAGTNRIAVVDLQSVTLAGAIELGGNPFGPIGLALTPDGSRLYVTHRGSNTVEVIDTAARRSIGAIQVGGTPVGIAVSPDGRWAFVASRDSGVLTWLDLENGSIRSSTPDAFVRSDCTTAVALSTDGLRAFVTSSESGTISVLNGDPDVMDPGVQGTIETQAGGLTEMAVVSATSSLLVLDETAALLLLVNVDPQNPGYGTVEQSITAGDEPVDVVVTSAEPASAVYVSSTAERIVTVFGL